MLWTQAISRQGLHISQVSRFVGSKALIPRAGLLNPGECRNSNVGKVLMPAILATPGTS